MNVVCGKRKCPRLICSGWVKKRWLNLIFGSWEVQVSPNLVLGDWGKGKGIDWRRRVSVYESHKISCQLHRGKGGERN